MANKMACSMKGCVSLMSFGQHAQRPVCEPCWQKLPQENRDAILAARHHGPRKRAEELVRAQRWLEANGS